MGNATAASNSNISQLMLPPPELFLAGVLAAAELAAFELGAIELALLAATDAAALDTALALLLLSLV